MRPDEVVRRYAALWAGMDAHSRTGDWRSQPRASRVRETEAAIRRWLAWRTEDERSAALAGMEATVRDITTTEAAMDSVVLFMDWPPRPSQAQVTCPCKPATECVLLFKEVGWGTDQDPADRATPEELAQCPLHHPPRDLQLRMVAPKGDIGKWWQKVKRQPARGLVLWHGAEGKVWCAGEASGNTVP
jgi:hypothetical protein